MSEHHSSSALIFANGDPNDGEMVRYWLHHLATPFIIAADGGARIAHHFGYKVQCVIGDMDSLSADELTQLEAEGALALRYPAEKDETDLELALKWAAQQGYTQLIIVGAMGGRFDQVLANVSLLTLDELRDCSVALVAGKQRIEVLRAGRHTLNGATGDTISLIPLNGAAEGITTQSLKYPLRGETLYIGPARGISNVMLADTATVEFTGGLLLLVHTLGTA